MASQELLFNPFPGLRPFQYGEQHLFFGREGQSEEILRRIRDHRFLAVVGTSGSGKSSLIRAGLLPDLYGGFLTNAGSHWRVAIFRPIGDPIGNLARALNKPDVLQTEAPAEGNQLRSDTLLEVTLRRGGLGLIEAARLANVPEGENLLIVVDQFEELFRFADAGDAAAQADDAAAFVKLLLEATHQTEIPIYVVITMRSDFIGDCARFRDLPEAVTDGMYLIPRMTREQRRRAIEEPIAVGGGAISLRLVNRLLNEVGDDPDQLPILQHALMRTWDYWVTHSGGAEPIDFADYEGIGGLSRALDLHADEAFLSLPDERHREIAKRMFQCLTEKGADNREVRRPTSVARIAAVAGAPASDVMNVVEEFHKQGRSFVTIPAKGALAADSVIDVSHESLIRLWSRLRDWVNQESESARTYKRLAEDAADHAKGEKGLLHDPELQNALNWRKRERPTAEWAQRYRPEFDQVMSFLDQSCSARAAAEAERERQRSAEFRRVRQNLIVVSVLSVIALAFAIVAGIEVRRARAATVDAKKKEGEALAASKKAIEEEAQAKKAFEEAEKQAQRANEQTGIANRAKGTAEAMTREARATSQKLLGANQSLNAESERRQKSDERFQEFLMSDMSKFSELSEETRSRTDFIEMSERADRRSIAAADDILKTDPGNRAGLVVEVVNKNELANLYQKFKDRKDAIQVAKEHWEQGRTLCSGKNYFQKTMGAALIASSGDTLRLLGEKADSLKAAKEAAEITDSVGLDADPKNEDAIYLNFQSVTYEIAAYIEQVYSLKQDALATYKKAVVARAKSQRISPSDYSATTLVQYREDVASLERELDQGDDALREYQSAIDELDSYLSGKDLTPAFSGVLVRLHADRAYLFYVKHEYSKSAAECEKTADEAERLDRRATEGVTQAVVADRTAGNAWYNVAIAMPEGEERKKYLAKAIALHKRCVEEETTLEKNDKSVKRYRSMMTTYRDIGDDYYQGGEFDEARPMFQKSVEAAKKVYELLPSNQSRRDLGDAYHRISRLESNPHVYHIQAALDVTNAQIEVLRELVNQKSPSQDDLTSVADAYGSRSWLDVQSGDFEAAISDADASHKYDPDEEWVLGNKAHALLFLRRIDEAKAVYQEYAKGKKSDASYQRSVFEDFETLRAHPTKNMDLKLLDDMETFLVSEGGYKKPEKSSTK